MSKKINKNWTGNSRSVHATLGARNYAKNERQEVDYYATDPKCAEDLLRIYPQINKIWECACGEGHMAKVFDEVGKLDWASDLYQEGYSHHHTDFLKHTKKHDGWIVTNPPYKYAQEFVEHGYDIASEGVAMFLKLQFLEGKRRRKMYKYIPPSFVYVYSGRQRCAMNGDFEKYNKSNAVSYAWFIWDKTLKGLREPTIRWI